MINSKLCGWYACERWGQFLPLTEFGLNRATKSKRNGYCRSCCAKKCADARKGIKQIRVSRKAYQISQARPATDMVMEAIRRGAHSRSEIKRVTKLSWDSTVDSIALLRFEQNVLQSRVVNGERMFFLRAA